MAASTAAAPPAPVQKDQHILMLLQMAAGAGAGAVAKTATAPLERIKILFQVQVRPNALLRRWQTTVSRRLGRLLNWQRLASSV